MVSSISYGSPSTWLTQQAANRRLVRRWFDHVWNKRRAEAIDEMFAANGVAHGKGIEGEHVRGPAGFKPCHQAYLSAFPDLRITAMLTTKQVGCSLLVPIRSAIPADRRIPMTPLSAHTTTTGATFAALLHALIC